MHTNPNGTTKIRPFEDESEDETAGKCTTNLRHLDVTPLLAVLCPLVARTYLLLMVNTLL